MREAWRQRQRPRKGSKCFSPLRLRRGRGVKGAGGGPLGERVGGKRRVLCGGCSPGRDVSLLKMILTFIRLLLLPSQNNGVGTQDRVLDLAGHLVAVVGDRDA